MRVETVEPAGPPPITTTFGLDVDIYRDLLQVDFPATQTGYEHTAIDLPLPALLDHVDGG
jgi:hypothetical protein